MKSMRILFFIHIFFLSLNIFPNVALCSLTEEQIAYIKILPYDKTREVDPFNPTKHLGRQYLYEDSTPNEYGRGKTFSYLKKDSINGQYLKGINLYMKDLIECREKFSKKDNKRNLLFIKLRIEADDKEQGSGSQWYYYDIGVFISGSETYTTSSIENFMKLKECTKYPSHPLGLSIAFVRFLEFWKHERIKMDLKKYTLINNFEEEKLNAEIQGSAVITDEEIDNIFSKTVYTSEVLSINGRKYAPYSSLFQKKPNDQFKEIIRKRLSANNIEINTLTTELFGKSEQECLGADIKKAFNQSEQTFLSVLDENSDNVNEDHPNFYSSKPLNNTKEYIISKVSIDLFSTFDVCLYCRGTLSYTLINGKMKTYLENFFMNSIRLKNFDFKGDNINIFAFSYEGTEVQ